MTDSSRQLAGGHRSGRAVVLLDVLLSLTLFALAAAVVGAALQSCFAAAANARDQAEGLNLVESVLAQLEIGQLEMIDTPPSQFTIDTEESEGVVLSEGWTYEIFAEDLTDLPGLRVVTVIVRHDQSPTVCRLTQWMPYMQEEAPVEEYLGGEGPEDGP